VVPESGLDLIADERERQLREEGWSDAHDDRHVDGALAMAAACYAAPRFIYVGRTTAAGIVLEDAWPEDSFGAHWDKRMINRVRLDTPRTAIGRAARLRELAKAGALVAAEIDRLQRISYAEARRQ
jgi:hypothetical protein